MDAKKPPAKKPAPKKTTDNKPPAKNPSAKKATATETPQKGVQKRPVAKVTPQARDNVLLKTRKTTAAKTKKVMAT